MATWTCASTAYADVAAKANSTLNPSLADGDTVVIPPGTSTWASVLFISKGITLQGSGIGSTIILEGLSSDPSIISWGIPAGKQARMTGIDFRHSQPNNHTYAISIGGSNTPNQFRMDHCRLNLLMGELFFSNVLGVVDHNEMTGGYGGQGFGGTMIRIWHGSWGGGLEGDKSWSSPSNFGSGDFLFFEDNTFIGAQPPGGGGNCLPLTDGEKGFRCVARHNSIQNGIFENHGSETRSRSCRAREVYKNTWTGNDLQPQVVASRGGVDLVWGNSISGSTANPFFSLTYYLAWTAPAAPWGSSDALNPWDLNDVANHTGNGFGGGPGGIFATATADQDATYSSAFDLWTAHFGGSPGWSTNQWTGYTLRRTNRITAFQNYSWIVSNTSNTITFKGINSFQWGPMTVLNGDTIEIRQIIYAHDMPGVGQCDQISEITRNAVYTAGSADITSSNHGLGVGTSVYVGNGSIPSNFPATYYYILSVTTNTFQIATNRASTTAMVAANSTSGTVNPIVNITAGGTSSSWPNHLHEKCWAWLNTMQDHGGPTPVLGFGAETSIILQNVHYVNYNTAFNGTTQHGVGAGTLANRPASSNTVDDAYWATDVASVNGSSDLGALYKWNGSTWVLYYQPFTYPHPLVSGAVLGAPSITSSLTVTATVGIAFTYQITATNSPTSFGASPLPAGLSVNSTGLISGTPTTQGLVNVTLSATNAFGTGTAVLALNVQGQLITQFPPTISSPTTASGIQNTAFSYQIVASQSPTSYSATGLPAGLSVNTGTGLISGTPTTVAVTNITIGATNSFGTGTAVLVLTVTAAAPTSVGRHPKKWRKTVTRRRNLR